MPKLHLKPAVPDLIVRDPITKQALPKEGKLVLIDSYWTRRIKAGDVHVIIHKTASVGPTEVDLSPQPEMPSAPHDNEGDE